MQHVKSAKEPVNLDIQIGKEKPPVGGLFFYINIIIDFQSLNDTIDNMKKYDVIVIGAGAAGLMAAAAASARNRRVAIVEMGETPARKVMASGGGKCNITNTAADYTRYFGKNPAFVRGALSRIKPEDILNWAHKNNIALYQKTPGRYFCKNGAQEVVDALIADVRGCDIYFNQSVQDVCKNDDWFNVKTNKQQYATKSLIVATGGISFQTLGVSDAGYKIAKKFGHKIEPVRPALCALAIKGWNTELAGISLEAEIQIGKHTVRDSLLFTHFGIGGPATYRFSLYDLNQDVKLNLCPNLDLFESLKNAKKTQGRKNLITILSSVVPSRIAKWILKDDNRKIADVKDNELKSIADKICNIKIKTSDIKYHGMQSAEVVRGGVNVDEISPKTMESKLCPGLFFAGEVMDIAGDLGGFNLQWAWSSGIIAGQNA